MHAAPDARTNNAAHGRTQLLIRRDTTGRERPIKAECIRSPPRPRRRRSRAATSAARGHRRRGIHLHVVFTNDFFALRFVPSAAAGARFGHVGPRWPPEGNVEPAGASRCETRSEARAGSTRPRSGCRSGDERDFHRDGAMPDGAAGKPRQEARSESAPDRLGCVVLPIRKAVASTSRWRNDSIPPERRFPEDAARRRAACRPQCRWEIEIQLQVAARLGACPSNVLDGGGED